MLLVRYGGGPKGGRDVTKRLDTLDRLLEVIAEHHDDLGGSSVRVDAIYCPKCVGERKVDLTRIALSGLDERGVVRRKAHATYVLADATDSVGESIQKMKREGIAPSLFMYSCVQCDTEFTAVVYRGPTGHDELAVFPSVYGGLATPKTPTAVAYYLDQAARAIAVGALSAAVAMYRSALEHLLEEQGFKERMCGPKLAALDAAIAAGKAPAWTSRVDTEFLKILKNLGNDVLHTNGGDVSLQEHVTASVLEALAVSFSALLDEVYERPERDRLAKERLKETAKKFEPAPASRLKK